MLAKWGKRPESEATPLCGNPARILTEVAFSGTQNFQRQRLAQWDVKEQCQSSHKRTRGANGGFPNLVGGLEFDIGDHHRENIGKNLDLLQNQFIYHAGSKKMNQHIPRGHSRCCSSKHILKTWWSSSNPLQSWSL